MMKTYENEKQDEAAAKIWLEMMLAVEGRKKREFHEDWRIR